MSRRETRVRRCHHEQFSNSLGLADVRACGCRGDTLDDAIEYALGPDCPLPEGEYVDDSIQVDDLVLNQEATHESHQ